MAYTAAAVAAGQVAARWPAALLLYN